MYLNLVIVILLVAVCSVKTQDYEDDIDALLCNSDEKTKSSVVECIALLPSQHFDVIINCDARLEAFRGDFRRLLDFYCNNGDTFGEIEKCITETYMKKGMSPPMESFRPVEECLEKLVGK